jgi:hypothetical protein
MAEILRPDTLPGGRSEQPKELQPVAEGVGGVEAFLTGHFVAPGDAVAVDSENLGEGGPALRSRSRGAP